MKRGGSLSFLVGTIINVLVMEIGWTNVGRGGRYILVSCAHSNTSFIMRGFLSGGSFVPGGAYVQGGFCHVPGLKVYLLTKIKSVFRHPVKFDTFPWSLGVSD